MKNIKKKAKAPRSFAQFAARMRPEHPLMAEFASVVRNSRPSGELDIWQSVRRYVQRLEASDAIMIGARLAWRDFKNKAKAQARN